jgi:hypothetical protein
VRLELARWHGSRLQELTLDCSAARRGTIPGNPQVGFPNENLHRHRGAPSAGLKCLLDLGGSLTCDLSGNRDECIPVQMMEQVGRRIELRTKAGLTQNSE